MDMIDKYLANPEIHYFLEGDGAEDWVDGPAKEAGYYILPFCNVGCCPPEGPFPDVSSAQEAALQRIKERQNT